MFGLPRLYVYGAVAALLLGHFLYQSHRVSTAQLGETDARKELAEVKASLAEAREANQAALLAKEKEAGEALAALAESNQREIARVQEDRDRTIADLKSGHLRMRSHWEAARATGELSAAIADAAGDDGSTGLRQQGAADLVRVGADADRRVIQLQGYIRAMERKINAKQGANPQGTESARTESAERPNEAGVSYGYKAVAYPTGARPDPGYVHMPMLRQVRESG